MSARPVVSDADARNRELHARWRAGDPAALDELVRANDALVRQLATRLMHARGLFRREEILADLCQEGRVALLACVRRWDPGHASLSTFARFVIRRDMRRYLLTRGGMIDVPCRLMETGPEVPYLYRDQANAARWGFVDPVDSSGFDALLQVEARPVDHDALLDHRTLWDRMRPHVERLEGREREVIVRRFGLDGEPPDQLPVVGKRWGVSKERARQVEAQALASLRRAYDAERRGGAA